MTSTERIELELDLLAKKVHAIDSDLEYKLRQHNSSMPTEPEMTDDAVALLVLSELARDRDRLAVEIAEKKMELYDLRGAPLS